MGGRIHGIRKPGGGAAMGEGHRLLAAALLRRGLRLHPEALHRHRPQPAHHGVGGRLLSLAEHARERQPHRGQRAPAERDAPERLVEPGLSADQRRPDPAASPCPHRQDGGAIRRRSTCSATTTCCATAPVSASSPRSSARPGASSAGSRRSSDARSCRGSSRPSASAAPRSIRSSSWPSSPSWSSWRRRSLRHSGAAARPLAGLAEADTRPGTRSSTRSPGSTAATASSGSSARSPTIGSGPSGGWSPERRRRPA